MSSCSNNIQPEGWGVILFDLMLYLAGLAWLVGSAVAVCWGPSLVGFSAPKVALCWGPKAILCWRLMPTALLG